MTTYIDKFAEDVHRFNEIYVVGAVEKAFSFLEDYPTFTRGVIDNFKFGTSSHGFKLEKMHTYYVVDRSYIIFTAPASHFDILLDFAEKKIPIDCIYIYLDNSGIVPLGEELGGFCSYNIPNSAKAHLALMSQTYLYSLYFKVFTRERYLTKFTHFQTGSIDDSFTQSICSHIKILESVDFSKKDVASGYEFNRNITSKTTASLNEQYRYLQPNTETINLCNKIIESCDKIIEPLTAIYEGSWSLCNVRVVCNRIEHETSEVGPSIWHQYGMPPFIFKLIIYLDGASVETGTTELKSAEGIVQVNVPPGGYLLFNPRLVCHRAKLVAGQVRRTIEMTICPTFPNNLNQIKPFAGTNAMYPVFHPSPALIGLRMAM
ncbi:hypothetical protein [Aliiglaciecola sp. NS0011-25]|uniref:hypothetical protein n=1 Tax=Aliiglaciecola sp. NS0011-25 TaxID=3127654 RepID=UPI003105CC2E